MIKINRNPVQDFSENGPNCLSLDVKAENVEVKIGVAQHRRQWVVEFEPKESRGRVRARVGLKQIILVGSHVPESSNGVSLSLAMLSLSARLNCEVEDRGVSDGG